MHHPWFPTRKASKLIFVCFQFAGEWHHPASWKQSYGHHPVTSNKNLHHIYSSNRTLPVSVQHMNAIRILKVLVKVGAMGLKHASVPKNLKMRSQKITTSHLAVRMVWLFIKVPNWFAHKKTIKVLICIVKIVYREEDKWKITHDYRYKLYRG